MNYIKEDNRYLTVFQILDKRLNLFYLGQSNEYGQVGKIYTKYSDCKRAVTQLLNLDDTQDLEIISFKYKLKNIRKL